jgi:hypothetical protein
MGPLPECCTSRLREFSASCSEVAARRNGALADIVASAARKFLA